MSPRDPRADADLICMGTLTSRELEVLRLLAIGMADKAIARECGISIATVRTHTHNIYRKLGVTSRAEAAAVVRAMPARPVQSVGETAVSYEGWRA